MKQKRSRFKKQLLRQLVKQSDRAKLSGNWDGLDDLKIVAHMARIASPRDRTINFYGLRLPLQHSLAFSSVLHPDNGSVLVSTVAI